MENLLRLIQSMNDMFLMPDFEIEDILNMELGNDTGAKGSVYAPEDIPVQYVEKGIEYAESIYNNIKNVALNNINTSGSQNDMLREKIYENINFADNKVIHKNAEGQNGFYSDLRNIFGDNSENFEDNSYYMNKKNNFIHNKKEFKEIYDYAESLVNGGDSIENNNSSSSVNINLGGVTQNITEANCDKVLEELGEMLLRTLSGCEGVY